MKDFVSLRWFSCVFAAFIILFTGIVSAHAATIAVTTTTDELADPEPGTGCSLREAIQSFNGAADYGGCTKTGAAYGTSDTINIPAGTYTIAIAGANEYLNATGSFDILNSVTILGAGAGSTTIDGGALDRVFFIDGVYAVSISDVTITNGKSGGGSGIYNNGGELTVINTTIRNNTAIGSESCGGGLAASVSNPITVTNSTISGNSAGYCGGGIIIWGSLTVTNSTISGNSAGSYGGGVFRGASGVGASIFTNSTISGNSGPNGGGVWNYGGWVTLSNTIVANQTLGADCAGSITSNGHNLESATTCGFQGTGDLQNSNPQLVALASNGGPTQTMALPAGSPAIDAGSCEQATDQRGVSRPQGAHCDIGAFEFEQDDITAPTVNTFTVTTPSNIINIPITAFTASDAVGVTGYLITTSATAPEAGAGGWSGTAPTTYTVASDGSYILYPWAKDAVGNVSAVFASPRTVVVDTTKPTVTSIIRVDASPTNLARVDFTVTFSESVTGVATGDFALTKTGTISSESVTGVNGGPTIYTVTVNRGNGNGTLRLDMPSSATITDQAGNPLDGLPYTGGETYTVEKIHWVYLPLIVR
jgi:CSLREA domain-containing protein